MINNKVGVSLGTAALISGLTLFVPTAPYAEFYVFEKLIDYNDAALTTHNLLQHQQLFLTGIYAILFTFLKDVMLAWTMYIFLRPVNAMVALLGAWLRILYAGLAIVALFNFIYAFNMINMPGVEEAYKHQQVLQFVNARKAAMYLAYTIFAIYLIIGGILIYRASYIPKVMGVLILLAGLAYFIVSLRPYFFNEYDLSWMMFFYVGEVVFAIWLLLKGSRIKEAGLREYSES